MARVRLIPVDTASPEQQAAFGVVARQRGRATDVWRAMAHSPALVERVGPLGEYLRFEAALSDAVREAVILAVAGRWGCAYQRRAHEPLAARAGLSARGLATLAAGEVPSDLPPSDALAVRYALTLSRDGSADEATVAALRAALGERGLVELTVLVGYYSMLALFLNGLAVGES